MTVVRLVALIGLLAVPFAAGAVAGILLLFAAWAWTRDWRPPPTAVSSVADGELSADACPISPNRTSVGIPNARGRIVR